MICDIMPHESWVSHAKERFAEAGDVGLVVDQQRPWSTASAFFPNEFNCDNVSRTNPDHPLREITGDTVIEKNKWVLRPDLMTDIAKWLCLRYTGKILFMEAGYAKIGDPHLFGKEYKIYRDNIFLYSRISRDNDQHIAKIIRQSRSFRILSIIVDDYDIDVKCPISHGAFLCDALDGDSMIIINW